jgi:hypothetical protein
MNITLRGVDFEAILRRAPKKLSEFEKFCKIMFDTGEKPV